MSNRTLDLDDRLYTYLLDISLREIDILKELRDETTQHPGHRCLLYTSDAADE